jgi:hypothetical protein
VVACRRLEGKSVDDILLNGVLKSRMGERSTGRVIKRGMDGVHVVNLVMSGPASRDCASRDRAWARERGDVPSDWSAGAFH